MPVAISNLTATWSNSSITYTGIGLNIANTGHHANSRVLALSVNNVDILKVASNGDTVFGTVPNSITLRTQSTGYTGIEMKSNTGGYIDFGTEGSDYYGRIIHNNSANTFNITFSGLNSVLGIGKEGVSINGNLTSNNITSNTISDLKGELRTIVVNSQTDAYVLTANDFGKLISITTGGVTVPNTIFSAGQSISVYNNSASEQIIANAGDVTMYFAGTANTSSKTLAQRGLCTVVCVGANTFVISGSGLT